ncbi:Ig-like domain-containing protein [Microbacterium sp. BDGP8]|uniref:OmpL47-type beta-barrel domain-containing protein n=1 Tax=Microbacterium sp. BDGP8 TaxID=3035531 RepID=UPI00249E5EEC|nr:Ig-like domain-containing protein [Microbacterium sp. BDGP8]WHE35744.1 Ig-like domain-containing protein [Microbacterium sp. BDGP8]
MDERRREESITVDCTPTTSGRLGRTAIATAAVTAVLATTFAVAPAYAANTDIGYPTFTGSPNPVPDTGVTYTPGNQLMRIFDADVAAGAGSNAQNDFWMDEMLARTGTAGSFGDNNQWLFTRGRAAFMKEHNPAVLGFAGQLAYWESIDGRSAYTITARVGGADIALTEDTTKRKQTPSYWQSVHTDAGTGIEVVQTKFITDANVLVTNLDVRATGGAVDVELIVSSPYAATAEGDELVGHVQALNDLTKLSPRLSGDQFAPAGATLVRTLAVPAGGTASTKVQLGLVTDEIADSRADYDAIREATSAAAYTAHVTLYNRWWAENVPYLDTPEDNIDKTLYYRWWLMRYNFLDADMPGNTYQFPTSMEGVLGYNNAIVLTTGMFIDDLKYFRDPIYSYGPWVSAGETSKSYKFVDNPGDPANWSNSYTQYISEAAWRAYELHGGPTPIAQNLAEYAEYDVKGLVDAYDHNGNGLIEYDWGAMTGNDADAVSFHWKGGFQDRAENAYLYSNALAAAEAYRVAGNTAKADEMEAFAQNIKTQVMDVLWNPDRKLLEHAMANNGEHVPWKEINNYYPFTVGLVPKPGDADYDDDYVEALRLFADDKQYPIFPFFTANQADQAAYNATGGQGSNNFSVINSTVTFRMLSTVLRDYPTDAINAEWYKKLLYWNAWAHYQNGGDNRLPDQNEFWANGSADPQKIDYRSWIHHTILGATNFTMIEDAMGVRTRSDAKIELDPIAIGWDHFTANNIRYRDRDLTVTWDQPGGERHYGDDVPEGYSIFLDGELAFTVDDLAHVVYDPATGEVEVLGGDAEVVTATASAVQTPQEVRFADDARIVDLFAKAGADIRTASTGSANLAESATATFSAPGREPAGAVNGTTINEPFWGTAGSPNEKDALTVELGGEQTFDDARVYFYDSSSSATAAGYAEPSVYTLEVRRNGQWTPIPQQARMPAYPRANYNHVQFAEVTGDAVRLTVTHAAGAKTGVKELQVFRTGLAAPESTNQAPLVTAWENPQASVGGAAALVGSVKDDGLPSGELSSQWTVQSAPDGATVLFDDAASASTTARFSDAGEYVLRLTATDGEKTSQADVTVQGEPATAGANVAPDAVPTAEYTASWNNVRAVNDGKVLFTGGAQSDIWGTWSGNHPATRWLQYEWQSPQRIAGAEISFWSDQADPASTSGVNVPKSWKAQYWTGSAWADVTGASAYGVDRTSPNNVTFDAVTTTRLRVVLEAAGTGSARAAVAVSELEVYADAPTAIEPIDVRTAVGTIPQLPTTVDATYSDGSHADLPVSWAPVTEDQVAGEGSFPLSGIVPGSPLPAKATVWVRATAPGQINQVDTVTTRTLVGVAPVLPKSVGVLFNDGSRQDLPVTWNAVEPASYAQAGDFTVAGTVQSDLPGTKAASAAVTVGGGGDDATAPTVAFEVSPAAPDSGWHTQAVTVAVTATDDQDSAPRTEVRVDEGAWTAYTAAVSVDGDGSHVVQARSTDAAGNQSAVAEQVVRIDTTAPVVEVTADAVSRTVKATATDAASGVVSVEYRLNDDQAWTPLTGSVLVGLDETRVAVRATDTAGNVSQIVERTVPRADGEQRRNVALLATPTASGTAGWNTVDGLNDNVQPTSSGDVTPNDNANVWGVWPEVSPQWVQYEWTEPVRVSSLGVYFVSNIDAQGLGIDVPKDWAAEYWDADAEAWVPVEATGDYGVAKDAYNTVDFAPVETTRLRLNLTPAGTESGKGSVGIKEWQVWEQPEVVVPDTQAPVVEAAVSPAAPASGWHTGTVSVSATAIDDRDDAPAIEVRVGDGAWAAYTAPVEVAADGTTTVWFRATDAAGNTSEPGSVEVKRDAAAPEASVGWNAASRTITPTGTDTLSGVALVEYRFGEGAWATATGGAIPTGDAATTAQVRVTDVAGNVSAVAEAAVPAKTTGGTDPGTDPGTGPGTDPGTGPGTDPGGEPSGSLTGDEVLRLGVTQVAPGGQLPVSVSGAKPGTVFAVEFRSTPVRLGTLTVGADGTASGVFTVPAYAEAGVHTVALVVPGGVLTAQVTVVTPGATSPTVSGLPATGQEAGVVANTIGIGASVVLLGLALVAIGIIRRRRAA